jgi:hypothetical protein
MTPQQIEQALRDRFGAVVGDEQRWQVEIGRNTLAVIADAQSDRLRAMIAVAAVDQNDPRTFRRLLEANFAAALDARYAIFNGVLWALFVSPLSVLTAHQLDFAISQVIELTRTTGTEYTASPTPLGGGFAQMH